MEEHSSDKGPSPVAAPKPKEKSKSKPKSSSSSSSAARETEKRIQALEQRLEAALLASRPQTPLPSLPMSQALRPTTPQGPGGSTGRIEGGDWSPDRPSVALTQLLPPTAPALDRSRHSSFRGSQGPSATFTPTAAGLRSQPETWQQMSPSVQEMIANAYSQGVAVGAQQNTQQNIQQFPQTIARNVWSAPPPSGFGSLAEEQAQLEDSDKDYDLSDDDTAPETPAVTGLFKPTLYRVLLNKAKQVADLPVSTNPNAPVEPPKPSTSAFKESQPESEHLPASALFVNNLKRPWQFPAAAQGPSNLERKFYTFDEDLEKLLEFPPIDQPVVTLVSNALVPSETGEGLKPEDRKAELLLRKTHQMSSWSFRSAAAASFFSRASVVWLQEMQSRLGPEDQRLRQDLSKLLAAAEFSSDASLHAAKFAARGIATTHSSRRLLWLRNWQADLKSKWRLASLPYQGTKLFGEGLDTFLVEDKDKKKVLPRSNKRQERRTAPYQRRQPFRWDSSQAAGQFSAPYTQGQYTPQTYRGDRTSFQGRGRGYQQNRRFPRGNQRGFKRTK